MRYASEPLSLQVCPLPCLWQRATEENAWSAILSLKCVVISLMFTGMCGCMFEIYKWVDTKKDNT